MPFVEVNSEESKLGLTANVAQNIVSLGGKAILLSVKGVDQNGEKLQNMLRESSIQSAFWVEDPSRPTLRKIRVIAGKQHVVRVDYELCHALKPELSTEFLKKLLDESPRA